MLDKNVRVLYNNGRLLQCGYNYWNKKGRATKMTQQEEMTPPELRMMSLEDMSAEESMECAALPATPATAILGAWTCCGKHVSWTASPNRDGSVYCDYDYGMEYYEGIDGSFLTYRLAVDSETLKSLTGRVGATEENSLWIETPYEGYGNSMPLPDKKANPIIKAHKYVETGKTYCVYVREKGQWIDVPEILYKDPTTGQITKGVILTGQPCDEYNKIGEEPVEKGKEEPVEKGKEYLIPIVKLRVDKQSGQFEYGLAVGPLNHDGGKSFKSIEETDWQDVKLRLANSLLPSKVTPEMIQKLNVLCQEDKNTANQGSIGATLNDLHQKTPVPPVKIGEENGHSDGCRLNQEHTEYN